MVKKMKYNGCTCKLIYNDYGERFGWDITLSDGSKDFAFLESIALMICDGRLKRAQPVN